MDMKTFKAALRRSWILAIVLFVASIFGASIYTQKRVPPTAKASVAVRDALTINPSQYTGAQVSFDAVVKSDRLAENVQKALGPGAPSIRGTLSVEALIPSNGINISPLYIVRAKNPDAHEALTIVKTAVIEARKLYLQLNKIDLGSVASVDAQRTQALAQLKRATRAFNDFNTVNFGSVGTRLSTLRALIGPLSDRLSQAEGDLAALQRVNDPASRNATAARVSDYRDQLNDATARLRRLETLEPQYQNLASDLSQARSSVQQLTAVRQSLVANASLPVDDQIKVLDDAAMDSNSLMKIMVYALGIILGLLFAMGAVYAEAARLRSRESVQSVIAVLGAPALGRIPRRAFVEVN